MALDLCWETGGPRTETLSDEPRFEKSHTRHYVHRGNVTQDTPARKAMKTGYEDRGGRSGAKTTRAGGDSKEIEAMYGAGPDSAVRRCQVND
jgi:hypothetical protein